jgi:RNA polymerase sigma factor (sigma-70 family)
MASARVGAVFRRFERLFTMGSVSGMTEGQLLDRFVTRHDQAAFEALVARHGPMVLGVCRRLLRNPDDAEDAFQATFLVLVRKAGSLRDRDLLANWLYGVAYRVSLRARAVSARRRSSEASAIEELVDHHVVEPGEEIRPWLRDEVFRLPEKYRAPIVLCYLEGLTHDEAADQLHWPVGTVKGRLSRARELLRSRLTRRGLAIGVSAGAVGELLAGDASAAVPPALVESTVKAAAMIAAGKAVSAGLVSAGAAALTEGTIQTMYLTKLKTAAALVAAGLLTTGVSVLAFQNTVKGGKETTEASRPLAAADSQPRKAAGPVRVPNDPKDPVRAAWEMVLFQFPDPTPQQIDRIAHWSRAMAEAEQYLAAAAGDDEKKAGAVRGHLDRMRQLYKITQGLSGPSQSQQADTARGWAESAERMLSDAAGKVARIPAPRPNPSTRPEQAGTSNEGGGGLEEDNTVIGLKARERLDYRMLARATGTPLPGTGGMGARTSKSAEDGGGGMEYANYDPKFMTRLDIAQLAAHVEGHDTNPRSRAIMKKLEEPIAMSFANETPLEDVLKYIKSATTGPNDTGIPIYVDPKGLEDATSELKSPVTLDLEGVPLKTTLRLILKQVGLAYCVKDGLLFISSPDGISQELIEFVATHPGEPADDGGSFGGTRTPY